MNEYKLWQIISSMVMAVFVGLTFGIMIHPFLGWYFGVTIFFDSLTRHQTIRLIQDMTDQKKRIKTLEDICQKDSK